MSRKNEDLIVLVLDRSGSMAQGYDKHLDGVNEFIRGQKAVPKDARMTLVLFDDKYEVPYSERQIGDVQFLTKETYEPRGMTALLDAVGRTINDVGRILDSRKEDDRPDHVVVVVQTDGLENASKEFSHLRVADMVKHQRERYGWVFVFLGADIDAVATASALNIPASHSIGYKKFSAVGTMSTYGAATRMVGAHRTGQSVNGFSDKDRDDAQKDDSK